MRSAKFYLAARTGRKDELLEYKWHLEKRGHFVTSRWLLRPEAGIPKVAVDAQQRETRKRFGHECAVEDLDDLNRCDALILFLNEKTAEPSRGGLFVELGYVMGLNAARSHPPLPIFLIGEWETNAFCCLPNLPMFKSFDIFMHAPKGLRVIVQERKI